MSYNLFNGFPGLALRKWASGNPLASLIACGVVAYNKPLIDAVGKQSREPQLSQTILGDGATYLDTGIVPNQNTALRVWGNFKNLVGVQQIGSRKETSERFYFGVSSIGNWFFGWSDRFIDTVTADTERHKFEISNKMFFIDDVMIYDLSDAQNIVDALEIFILSNNRSGTSVFATEFNLDRAEIDTMEKPTP